MKKSSLALAAALACAGSAQAQTTVTLYGIADGDVRFDHTALGTLKSLGSGGEASSRWGLRGTEDLGNGLKAVFNFEQDFDLSDNSAPQGNIAATGASTANLSSSGSRFFGRRAIVGLNSPQFGEIRFGREYTPLYQAWSAADPFGAGTVARATNYSVGNVTRFDNSVTYESPSYQGLQLKAQFRPGESTTNLPATATKNGGNGYGASLTYAKGPIYAGIGFISGKNSPDNNTTRGATATAVYDFGILKLHGLYFFTKNATTLKQQAYALGLTVPVGAFKFLANVARIDNKYDTNNSPLRLNDATLFGFGGNYAFSKRTDLYLVYSKAVNKGASAIVLGDNSNNGLFTAVNVPAGFDPWSAQFGIRHLF